MPEPTEEFWGYAGFALVIFAICVGIGSCSLMEGVGRGLSSRDEVSVPVASPPREEG